MPLQCIFLNITMMKTLIRQSQIIHSNVVLKANVKSVSTTNNGSNVLRAVNTRHTNIASDIIFILHWKMTDGLIMWWLCGKFIFLVIKRNEI